MEPFDLWHTFSFLQYAIDGILVNSWGFDRSNLSTMSASSREQRKRRGRKCGKKEEEEEEEVFFFLFFLLPLLLLLLLMWAHNLKHAR